MSDPRKPVDAPEWVQPFLEVDAAWQHGGAHGFTSGSTGVPKRFDFDPKAIVASAQETAAHFGLTRSERCMEAWSALPASGIGGRMMWWRSRVLGWNLTQTQPSTKPEVPNLPDGNRYDFAVATPQQAAHLAESGQLTAFQCLLLGGGAVPPALEARLVEAGSKATCDIHLGYGMTETLTHVATRRLGHPTLLPLPGVSWRIAEDGGLTLDIPSRGVRDLHTRDAVASSTDSISGRPGFQWLGRLDDAINTGGLKVHPAELEAKLDSHITPHTRHRRWYVAGRPHPVTGFEVTVVVEGAEDPGLAATLLHSLAAAYPFPDRPRSVVWVDAFEETATGKVLRR